MSKRHNVCHDSGITVVGKKETNVVVIEAVYYTEIPRR